MKYSWTVLFALLHAAGVATAAAQVVGDGACPKHAVDIASFATCDGDRVARADAVERIAPQRAHELKRQHGRAVLLIDVRSKAEAALTGVADGVDALVPYAELAQPLRWDPARGDLALTREANFAVLVQAWVAALDGDRRTPLLLICRNSDRSLAAAQALKDAGFERVAVVDGGFDGAAEADGLRRGSWKSAGLPWRVRADAALLFGDGD